MMQWKATAEELFGLVSQQEKNLKALQVRGRARWCDRWARKVLGRVMISSLGGLWAVVGWVIQDTMDLR